MQGTRLPDGTSPHLFKIGEYAKGTGHYLWCGRCPSGDLANLTNHTVVENEDNSITVTPSILVGGQKTWHGYLTNGVWNEV